MKVFGLIKIAKRLFGVLTKGTVMAKTDVVSAGVAAIQAGEVQVYSDQLGLAYDGGFSDGVASLPVSSGGGFQQSDIDAAVSAAVAPLNQSISDLTAKDASDVQALSDAQAQGTAALAALQGQFDTLSAKEGQEASVIAGLQGSLSQMQNVVAILQGILAPPVSPDPAPAA